MASATIDHLVLAARTLEQGTEYVKRCIGFAPSWGGRHVAQGTHNRLLKLGERCYLEVIAIDPGGVRPDFPRWFDLDSEVLQSQLRIQPRLVTWVARTDDLETLHRRSPMPLGSIRPMQRGNLSWKMTFTEDGGLMANGLVPHLIQWDGEGHPADHLEDRGCSLARLDGFHADAPEIIRVLETFGLEREIHVSVGGMPVGPCMRAHILTPDGLRMLT